MMRSLYTAATGMDAQQTKMDTIANNLANANTTGFKKSRADFEDLLSETIHSPANATPQGGTLPAPLQVGLGVRTATTTRTFSQGDFSQTDNPLDVAIQGPGFFRVMRPNGEYGFTRAGNFKVDADGRMVTQRGELLEPSISVPRDAVEVLIESDGKVSAKMPGQTKNQELGQLELSTFVNPAGLEAIGGNLFVETQASGAPMFQRPGENGTGSLGQGFLESSNVKAVEEMVAMISTQRSYELNSKVIQTADQMLQRLTSLRGAMGALLVMMMVTVSPQQQQLEAALQRALMRAPAKVELVRWDPPRCAGTLVPAPFENSGRVAVRVRGKSCEAWGWAIVKVIVPLATLTRDVRSGESLDGAFELVDGETTADALDIMPGSIATRPLKRGAVLHETDLSFGPRPGTAITVRVHAGSLSIEQRGVSTPCTSGAAYRSVCATLPTGKRVAGTWSGDALTVETP